jgi:hypothetical protein
VFFHLWNHSGLDKARISSTSDSGPHFEWVLKKSRKSLKTFADAVRRSSPLLHRSSTRSFCSRLNFNLVPNLNLHPRVLQLIRPPAIRAGTLRCLLIRIALKHLSFPGRI